jgi:hypothetical protein
MSGSLTGSGGDNLPTGPKDPFEKDQAEGSCTATGTDDSEQRVRVDHGQRPAAPANAEVFKKSRVPSQRQYIFIFGGRQAAKEETEFDSPDEPHGKRRRVVI